MYIFFLDDKSLNPNVVFKNDLENCFASKDQKLNVYSCNCQKNKNRFWFQTKSIKFNKIYRLPFSQEKIENPGTKSVSFIFYCERVHSLICSKKPSIRTNLLY